MTTDPTPPSPEPGPDAGIDDTQADIEHTRTELGETIGALSAKADVTGRVQHTVADTKDRITEKASETKDVVVGKAHAAQSAARDVVTDSTGSVKPSVPIAALVAAAAVLAISVAVWRRRR
jgi:cobalamin biosynthesis Mg chelatase CobN